MIKVAKNGSGDFATITEALFSLEKEKEEAPAVIWIGAGIYKERIIIKRPNLTFIGESAGQTILTGDLFAKMPCDDIGKLGTFRSYSAFIDTHDFTAINLTFENSAGAGTLAGQALALYADGDRLSFYGCRFLGGQDTLFTAPLPPVEIESNGFIGPKQYAPRNLGRHYYKDCYIEGDIDFIFGGATAFFDRCQLHSKYTGRDISSFVTAASTPEGVAYGYVMDHCHFTSNCPPNSTYLGRPWREYAKTVLLFCTLEEHICPEGWHDWNKTDAQDTIYFGEYNSTGPSSDMKKRPGWVKQLTQAEANQYQKHLVLRGTDGWNPEPPLTYRSHVYHDETDK